MHSHEAQADTMYIDVGLYGEPKVAGYNPTVVRQLELFVLELNG